MIWTQAMVIYDPKPRKLTPEEKRENNPDSWTQLIQYMDAIIFQAQEVRQFAHDRRTEVEEGRQW